MKIKVGPALLLGIAVLAALIVFFHFQNRPGGTHPDSANPPNVMAGPEESASPPAAGVDQPRANEPAGATGGLSPALESSGATLVTAEPLAGTTNRLERINQTREAFRLLAAGDRTIALRAAKQVTNETERETALLTLVTEWTQGEISSPRQRARAIAVYGLEAGLGIELAKEPELAVLWAKELTDGPGRTAVLQQTAVTLLSSDPAGAFALSEQIPESDRRSFSDSVFAGWASKDTEAALQWAGQLSDPAEQDAAMQAIRSVAPVGIGAALSMQNGYPTINSLLPGTPAELSGQLRQGDRIVALAQGDNAFVDARNLPLADVVQRVRGAPGTVLQLQVLPGDASPDSPPRIVSITRDQIKFKQ